MSEPTTPGIVKVVLVLLAIALSPFLLAALVMVAYLWIAVVSAHG
jgi:hypothetical protein